MTSFMLALPFSFVPPKALTKTTPEENAFILELGCHGFSAMSDHSNKRLNEDIYRSLEKQADERFLAVKTALKNELEITIEEVKVLKAKLLQEAELRRGTESAIRDAEKKNREEICKEKDARIQFLQADIERINQMLETTVRTSNKELEANFNQFKEQFLKMTTASTTKGKAAEAVFTELLQRTFGSTSIGEEFSIQNLGNKEAHKGDIHMRWRGALIMWETKDYSKIVDNKEVLKFQEDMMTNPEIAVGILVSMASGIQGHMKSGDIDLQVLPDGRMTIYINNFDKQEDAQYYLQSLQPFLEVFSKRKDVKGEKDEVYELEKVKKTNTILGLMLKEHQKKAVELRNSFNDAKKKQEQIWTELQVKLKESENSTKHMLKTLMDVDEEGDDEIQTKDNEDIFFKAFEWDLLTDEQKKFIETMRASFNFVEDCEVLAKDVREILKTAGIGEKQIIKYQETLVLESAWKKGSTKVMHLSKVV